MMANLIEDGTLWPVDEVVIGKLEHLLRHGKPTPGQMMECAWILRSYFILISGGSFPTETALKKLRMIRRSVKKNRSVKP